MKPNWVLKQFKVARQEVRSWSRAKQTVMKNAIRIKQLTSEEKQCTICTSWVPIVIGSMPRYCEKSKQWPRKGTCRYRTVEKGGEVKYDD